MGNGYTTDKPPVTEAPEVNVENIAKNEQEWHVLEFHIPTAISGGAGLLGLGIAAYCLNKCYKKWLLKAHEGTQRRMAELRRRDNRARMLAQLENGNAPPDDEDYQHKY